MIWKRGGWEREGGRGGSGRDGRRGEREGKGGGHEGREGREGGRRNNYMIKIVNEISQTLQ